MKKALDFLKTDIGIVVKWLEYSIFCIATRLSGSVVEVGNCSYFQFDGVEEGIYERFDLPKYGRRLSYTLVPHGNMISSVFGVGWNE